jgi:hypothetical protein
VAQLPFQRYDSTKNKILAGPSTAAEVAGYCRLTRTRLAYQLDRFALELF